LTTSVPHSADQFSKLAETNLRGVTAIQWLPQAGDKPLSHAEAIANDLLGPLPSSDQRVAALRQHLIVQNWPDDARIVPHLVPQPGVTHERRPAGAGGAENTSISSQNWAGSTVAGTWAHAVGVWRVPTVSRPSAPAGNGGNWNSSSWVGLDGGYKTTDVLQAGVQQIVNADGSTTYVAWYEWYTKNPPAGSPAYVDQTNIDNMLIEPGDEVFAGVHYQNGQGLLMFGNVDRGHYFSIQVAPPPGVTFSGESAEWIVEAPDGGEPGVALARFTPVNFTAAFGSNAASTATADPKNGDTQYIVDAFGRPLTSTTLETDALTVTYLDAGFFPLPGKAVFDHTKQRIAAVSRAPGNLDLFVNGFNNRVWTTFWNQSGWNSDWFQLPGTAAFDYTTQQIAAVSRAPGNLDLFMIDSNNHVWTTYWNPQAGWDKDPNGQVNPNGHFFQLPGAAIFDHTKQKIAAVSRAPGNLDLFVIGLNNRVWSTFWNDKSGWNSDWFQLPGTASFDFNTQQIAAVSRAPGNLDLFMIDSNDHVWTTYWNVQAGWDKDPNGQVNPNGHFFPLPGVALFDHTAQRVAAVSRAPGNLDLFAIDPGNHVQSEYWNDHVGWN
jgi:Peptidase A4 family